VFCGERRADNKEHALPDWLTPYLLDLEGHDRILHRQPGEAGERRRITKRLDLEVKRICARCNQGWMSELETAIKPVLVPLLQGQDAILPEAGQRLLAFWTVKTASMLQFTSKEHPVPPDYLREVYENRESRTPPRTTQIWVGACADRGLAFHTSRGIEVGSRNSPDDPSARWAKGYGSTIRIGHLVLKVFAHRLDDGPTLKHSEPHVAAALPELWPYGGRPIRLPPEAGFFDLDGVLTLASFGVGPEAAEKIFHNK
jgi:hypothetical protein